MVPWRSRHLGYKLGFLGLVFSVTVYVVGFSLPYWAVLRIGRLGYADQNLGLWQSCLEGSTSCISNVHANNPPWINATRVTSSFAVILFAFAFVSGCYRNFTALGQLQENTLGRQAEGSALLATVLGFVGCIIYAAEFHRAYVSQYALGNLHWAFGVVCVALSLSGSSACLMFAYNRNQHVRAPPATSSPGGGARSSSSRPGAVPATAHLHSEGLHIPYFGQVLSSQMVHGANPTLPPSYEAVTRERLAPAYETVAGTDRAGTGMGGEYSDPPADASEAPPLYEDIAKDLSALPPEVIAHLAVADKDDNPGDPSSTPQAGLP